MLLKVCQVVWVLIMSPNVKPYKKRTRTRTFIFNYNCLCSPKKKKKSWQNQPISVQSNRTDMDLSASCVHRYTNRHINRMTQFGPIHFHQTINIIPTTLGANLLWQQHMCLCAKDSCRKTSFKWKKERKKKTRKEKKERKRRMCPATGQILSQVNLFSFFLSLFVRSLSFPWLSVSAVISLLPLQSGTQPRTSLSNNSHGDTAVCIDVRSPSRGAFSICQNQ